MLIRFVIVQHFFFIAQSKSSTMFISGPLEAHVRMFTLKFIMIAKIQLLLFKANKYRVMRDILHHCL